MTAHLPDLQGSDSALKFVMFITGLGTATPPKRYTQIECWEVAQSAPKPTMGADGGPVRRDPEVIGIPGREIGPIEIRDRGFRRDRRIV